MPPLVLDLKRADDPRDVVHRAVQALAEGKLVAFPTETVYILATSALSEPAVQRLSQLAQPTAGAPPLTLAIKSADNALDYIPALSPLARRLTRRCWPGPVTLVLADDHPDSVIKQLPTTVQDNVAREGYVSLSVPAHPVISAVLRLFAGPLAVVSATLPSSEAAVTAQEVAEAYGDRVDMILDDGRSKYAQPPSMVRVEGRHLQVLRSGIFAPATIRRFADLMVLVVCTGNTCRSPMAEALLKKQLAKKLGCAIDELESRGVIIMSAGIAAMAGGRAADEAISTMQQQGLDITRHESQPLTERLVRYADLVLSMTRGHREAILTQWPDAAGRIELVSRDRQDISDPIGGPADVYRRCADQIDAQLAKWVDELDLDSIALPDEKP